MTRALRFLDYAERYAHDGEDLAEGVTDAAEAKRFLLVQENENAGGSWLATFDRPVDLVTYVEQDDGNWWNVLAVDLDTGVEFDVVITASLQERK